VSITLVSGGIALRRVVVMRRYLVVANQTLQAAELRDELGTKIGTGPCSFFVIVPDTKAADCDAVAADGVLPQPACGGGRRSTAALPPTRRPPRRPGSGCA
jgi:hypothetical protein